VPPPKASSVKEPFDSPDWVFEIKLDGYRANAVFDVRPIQSNRTGNKSFAAWDYKIEEYMNRYISLFVLCLIVRSGFGMGGPGSGSSGGGTGSGGGGNMSQIEERSQEVRLYDQGVKAMNSKRFAEAEARFAQALRSNPRFAEAHNYLGYSLAMQGPPNYLMALQHYNRAIQLKPNLAEAYENRGMLLLKMDRESAAKRDLAILRALNPGLAVELERVMKEGKEASRSIVKQGGRTP
jgi:tetratricopeptide (TPR) repeat protein